MDKTIDFSKTIHFVKPNVDFDLNDFELLNSLKYDSFYETIAKFYSIKKNEIELFNSQSSAIFSLLRYLHLEKCYLYSPIYQEYKRAAIAFGYDITFINRFENIEEEIQEDSLVIFANPSYPDGKYYDIANYFAKWTKANATIIIDESFLDFTNEKSAIDYLKCYPKLYIIKSFAHFYGISHLKISAILSNKVSVQKLKQKEPLDKISLVDVHYICEALKDKSFKKIGKALASKNNILLEQLLQKSNFFEKIYPSSTNLILAKLSKLKAIQLQELFIKHKILIQNYTNFDSLDESYLGFCVQNTKDLELLEKILKELPKY